MTLTIKVRMERLKGKKIIMPESAKKVLAGMLSFIFSNYGGLKKEQINAFLEWHEKEHPNANPDAETAKFYLRAIANHVHSFEIIKVEVL